MSGAGSLQVPPACDLTLGIVCTDKSTPGRTTWQMPASERFANPAGILQGGFLAALCDSAMGASTITWARHRGLRVVCANVELKCSFVKAARVGTMLTCTAWVLDGGSRTCFVEADVVDGDGRLVVKASSTYVLTNREAGGPSGPAERGAGGPSGPAERGAGGPSGPAEREAQG